MWELNRGRESAFFRGGNDATPPFVGPIDGPPTASRGVRRGWLVRVSSHTSSV